MLRRSSSVAIGAGRMALASRIGTGRIAVGSGSGATAVGTSLADAVANPMDVGRGTGIGVSGDAWLMVNRSTRNAMARDTLRTRVRTVWPSLPLRTTHPLPVRPTILPT